MKTVKSFLFIAIISVTWLGNIGAYGAGTKKPCPPGCFCVHNGQIPTTHNTRNICGYGNAYKVSCDAEDIAHAFGIEDNQAFSGLVACGHGYFSDAVVKYYFDEFSELFQGATGMYGLINNELIVMPSTIKALNDYAQKGIYQCPVTYPNSASGAKTVFDCYKYDANGNKVYYRTSKKNNRMNCNIAQTELLIKDLQSTLNDAIDATDALQNALNSNNKNALLEKLKKTIDKANNTKRNLQTMLK